MLPYIHPPYFSSVYIGSCLHEMCPIVFPVCHQCSKDEMVYIAHKAINHWTRGTPSSHDENCSKPAIHINFVSLPEAIAFYDRGLNICQCSPRPQPMSAQNPPDETMYFSTTLNRRGEKNEDSILDGKDCEEFRSCTLELT